MFWMIKERMLGTLIHIILSRILVELLFRFLYHPLSLVCFKMSVIDSFLKSIRQKKINEVEQFLESGQSPYQWSSTYEHSSFHYACKYFEKTIFDLLIHESLLIEDFTEKWHQKDGGAKVRTYLLFSEHETYIKINLNTKIN